MVKRLSQILQIVCVFAIFIKISPEVNGWDLTWVSVLLVLLSVSNYIEGSCKALDL